MKIKNIDENFVFGTIKKRDPDSHKGSFGTLTAVCGSKLFPGAAALSVSGALRSGAGIVRLASTDRVTAITAAKISECVFLPLPEGSEGGISKDGAEAILEALKSSSACLCGCGMINCADTFSLVSEIVGGAECYLVIDADGLNVLEGRAEILKKAAKTPTVTPHLKEFARLSGKDIEDIKKSPAEAAAEFAAEYNCVTVLKGSVTHIASPAGEMYRYSRKNPGLARGGSGDVLAGIISGLVCRGIAPFEAAVCGVYLHGEAAARTAARLSETGMLPGDILFDMCGIFREHGR